MTKQRQPWLANPLLESLFILLPGIVPVAIVLMFQDYFTTHEVSTFWWIVLVICIDVSHVYSTLFRLYWDKETFIAHRRLLIIIPAVAFVVGFSLHWYDSMLFWRILAYVAVYHFVRQQYGFIRLYARNESFKVLHRRIDTFAVYNATVYPLLYWHIHATDKIAWFIKGGFVSIDAGGYDNVLTIVYAAILLAYIVKEVFIYVRQGTVNVPKNLIMAGTYLSWYFGIVAFQGDLIFTILNVVVHGIPYMALIWLYGEKKSGNRFSFGMKQALVFVSVLIVLAYCEEYFWDAFIWNDHEEVFFGMSGLTLSNSLLVSLLVAVLVLPQVTHYVLDGFIWRFSKHAGARI